jgi:hypothetical protein
MITFQNSKFTCQNLILIQWLDEEDWIKSMYIKYAIYILLIAIGLHVCGSQGIIKQIFF